MAREHLEGRENWQAEAAKRGLKAEIEFSAFMTEYLSGTEFVTEDKPNDLAGIYGSHETGRPHGIRPEYVIRNSRNGKAIYVEVKRQRAVGNAHERACKYMMPGILRSARAKANQVDSTIPFWWVFSNGIATSPRYQQEIMHWFSGIERHVLLWQDMTDGRELSGHFDQHIRPLLL